MSASNIAELMAHAGHRLEIAWYGPKEDPESATIECLTCHEVVAGFEKAEEEPVLCTCGHELDGHHDGARGDSSGACRYCGCSEFMRKLSGQDVKDVLEAHA